VNRSRAGGSGRGGHDEGESRPGGGRPDDAYDSDAYEDRADYRDFDAQYGADGYDDGAFPAGGYEGGTYENGAYEEADYEEPAYASPRYAEADPAAAAYGDEYDDYDEYEDEYEDEPQLTNQIFTIPNLISLARLAGVPLFLGLILSPYYGGPKYDYWALLLLALSGFSDWLDGKLARRWNQMTKLGTLLDPLADRLYILATLVGLTMRHIIPLWLPIVLIGRDVALLTLVPRLRKAGYGSTLPVHFLGKAATFNLLYAFPLLLLGQISESHKALMDLGNIFGWAFVGWGTALYLLAGGMYFLQTREVTREAARAASRGVPAR
jgi:cardiolipin synthase